MRRRRVKASDEGAVAAGPPSDQASSGANDDVEYKDGARRKSDHNVIAFRHLDESPRQVLTGAVLCASLAAVALDLHGRDANSDENLDAGASFRSAALGALILLVSYTFLNARDGPMRRPHPGVWRALHGCNLWYCAVCAAFLVVRAEDGAAMMKWLFPGVTRADDGSRGPLGGVGTNVLPGLESDGGGGDSGSLGMDHLDCQITLSNVRRQVFGLWFFAHCVGWWAKMLMIRDLRTCIVYSTIFEFVELTLQVLVPEFQECWWDSIGLDWLIANTCVGMTLGVLTHRYLLRWPNLDWNQCLEVRKHRLSWHRSEEGTNVSNDSGWRLASKLGNALTPASWRRFDWNPDNDPVSIVLNSAIWIAMLIGEINSFFLINILQLPRDHAFNMLRQAFFCFTALPACEEWYEYTRHVRFRTTGVRTAEYDAKYAGNKPRIGQSAWLLAVTAFVETAAIVKYSLAFNLFSRAGAFTVGYWGPWLLSGALFGTYLAVHYIWYRKMSLPRWLGMLKWLSPLPLLLLMRNYAF